MTQTKTKKALLMSVLSMVLCVAMLVGMTFAWFTDTASTAVNTIKSGELKIGLKMSTDNGASWEDAKGKTLNFMRKDAEGKLFADANILWEPGATFVLPQLKIVNEGNLALKYKVVISGATGDTNLLDVIKFTADLGDGNPLQISNGSTILEGHMTDTNAEQLIKISATMDKNAGNEYQSKTLTGITITVYATQLNHENDSTGPNYDIDAPLPTAVSNQDDVNSAIQDLTNKNVVLALPKDKTITLDNGIAHEGNKSRNVTFVGDGSQTVDVATKAIPAEGANHLNYQRGSTFTFENVTVENGTDTYDGIVCDELIYKNCTIKGVTTLYGKATFINCKFENTMANQYSIWTWGGTDVAFEGCTFNTNGKAILLFGEEKTTNLTVNNCTFNDRTNGAAKKAAIEVGEANYGKHNNFTLVINNSSVASGFADGKNTDSKLWANKNNMDAAHLSVTIDGTKVQ